MKNLKLIGFLMILASSLMFIQCTSEAIPGTAGIDGTNGLDGADGLNGVGVQECVACHSNTHRDAIYDAFALSQHAEGATVAYAGGRDSCSRCHSNEGYVNFITGKTAVAIANPTAISCTTCHNKHSSFDFVNDGNDLALRNIGPTPLDLTDVGYVIDYGNKSNVCVSCHQPRSKAPVDADNDGLYLQANSRFYPHYGGQSTMLEGIQGAVIANGSTPIPAAGSAAHRTGASCTACHMGASTDGGEAGLHTFNASFSAPICKTCHTAVPTEVAGLAADMATLHDKLFELGLIAEDGSTLKQTELIPFKTAQALWNYKTVEEDHSHGVHNPNYAKALIKNALEAVN
ncbi:MAG: hypothetical protein IBX66_00600 [Lutibacter sp.]|nr:hypothetical protein [Lutibacter sp.]